MPDRAPPPPHAIAQAGSELIAWFEANARPLPWRRDRRPYAAWVAEIMLQQTRAATAAAYYPSWMARFPDVTSLAAAEEAEVLRYWEGLGYYRRARMLHRAARRIVFDHGGVFPRSEEGWRALPGVGPYTAAAVCAMAFDAPTVAVDGNVRRVGARLLAQEAPRDADLRRELATLLPRTRSGRGAEALIELGATVCGPSTPACGRCPLAAICRGHASGTPEAYPTPRARAAVPTRRRFARLHLDGGHLYLVRRSADGLLGGLWGPPQQDLEPDGRRLATVRHVYSHFRLELVPVVVHAPPDPAQRDGGDRSDRCAWVHPRDLQDLPMSRVDRAVIQRLREERLLASET
ncbi:MAG: A/G-specific adenine glycosylase [Trueperaceae bacterium]|nr:A/G-specific adenine glycosylase [Trueperaceae bacterium]